ncbi:Cse1 [Necator americanus]|uniref:Cse1 n=1 Tax=Necator americanus TaxID=51031 RepID=W2T3S2_NECAM|nr:Cse1 [Necator americanus]ETN75871.1 Cse1 [Necator americanus]
MKMDCPKVTSSGGEPTFLDELKMEVCEIFTLYAQRFEEEISPFMQNIIQAKEILCLRFDGMVCAALEFLSIISQKTHYESYFVGEGVLQTIAQDVCVKNMHLRQEDLELLEDEPIDFMKKDIEGTDSCTRRRGAIDLVRALCRKYEERLVPILAQIVQSLCSDGDWMKLDVVYCLVTAIASKTETAKSGATSTSQLINVADYYAGQVRGHLSANGPLLTAKVVPVGSLLGNLVACFDKDTKAQNSPYLIKAVLRCVAILDEETARHGHQIASKLSSLVAAAIKNPADAVHTHFLFETMCVLIKKTETLANGSLDGELMPLIETILSQDLADLVPYALQITGEL